MKLLGLFSFRLYDRERNGVKRAREGVRREEREGVTREKGRELRERRGRKLQERK